MKVRHADDESIIVELTLQEFAGITGELVKTSNKGEYHTGKYARQTIGNIYDIKGAIDAWYSLKVVNELKERLLSDMESVRENLEKVMWPIPEHFKIKPEESK